MVRPTSWPVFDRPEDIDEHFKAGTVTRDSKDSHGRTLLHHARSGWEVRELVKRGVELNTRDRDGKTAFDTVWGARAEEATQALVLCGGLAGAQIDQQAKSDYLIKASGVVGERPFPIFKDPQSVLDYFSDPENDPNQRDKAGNTILFYAREDWEIQALVGCGVPVNGLNHQGKSSLDVMRMLDGDNAGPRATVLESLGGRPGTEVRQMLQEKEKERKQYEDYLASIQAGKAGLHRINHSSTEMAIATALLTQHKVINKVQVVENRKWELKPDKEGNTDLHRLAVLDPKMALAVIRQAQKEGVDINIANNKGQTPLHRLLAEVKCDNRRELVMLLLQNGASLHARDAKGHSPAHVAVRHPDIFKILAERDPRIVFHTDKTGGSPLFLAKTAEQAKAVLAFGDAKAQMGVFDSQGRNAIHVAASGEVTRALLDAGDDPMRRCRRGMTPAHYAITAGSLAELSRAGANLGDQKNEFGYSVAHQAASAETAGWIINNGYKRLLESRDRMGYTPMATVNTEAVIAKFLAAVRADSRCANDSRTPAMAAAINGLLTAVTMEVMENYKIAMTGIQDSKGNTLMHRNTNADVVSKLAKLDPVAVNQRNKMGVTPLGMATTAPMVAALLRCGADPKVVSNSGQTMAQLLESRGLEIPTDLVNEAAGKVDRPSARKSEHEHAF